MGGGVVVAPRILPESCGAHTPSSREADARREREAVAALAARWAQLGPGNGVDLAVHLSTVLRRLATTLRAEPFWPFAAREIGGALLRTGLCGDLDDPARAVEDVVAPSLRLLREEAAGAFGTAGPEGERRLTAVLDEVVAGLLEALHERHRLNRPDEASRIALRTPAISERHIRAAYSQAAVGIGIAGLDGLLLDINPALCRMFGLDGPLDQPRPVSDFVHPDDMLDVVERLRGLVRGEPEVVRMELRLVRPDSGVLWVHVVASRVLDDDGGPSHLMGVVEDVSERHRLRSRLAEVSHQDQLTRLPNRAMTEQWLSRAFAGDGPARVGICALDLDGFHPINDGLGQQIGDRLLLGDAERLQLAAGDHLVARTGGDEFAVLMTDPEGAADAGRLADRLQAALAVPFHINGHTLAVSASIGVAEGPTATGCPVELMRSADVACSWAKALGGGRRVVFDHERDAGESARFALLAGMRGAIGRGEFRLVYQPLIRLADGRVQGAEALVRWQHPEQGLIGPGRFIELAEHSGTIVPLGRWVLETACAQAAGWWRELGAEAPFVSVNVSPVQLAEVAWVDEVTGVLAATGLPPHLLQLEITEQAVLGEEACTFDALAALRAAGVRLALDDFGTGYSSLAWLRRLPVHALKIDGSFIDGLRNPCADPTDSSIVRALIGMAHALGLEVTAEWVETGIQSERLARLGCDVGQGRWFGDAGPGEWVPGLWRRSIGS
jgi:diguanylate cyclase (GGDEF)-like protein/PAS domain S-box-containing protein